MKTIHSAIAVAFLTFSNVPPVQCQETMPVAPYSRNASSISVDGNAAEPVVESAWIKALEMLLPLGDKSRFLVIRTRRKGKETQSRERKKGDRCRTAASCSRNGGCQQ